MQRFRIGVIRVVTLKDKNLADLHGKLLEKYFDEFESESFCIENQPEGIHDELSYKVAYPKIIKIAKQIQNKFNGLVVSCAGDPAVSELKQILEIPVTGAGEPTARRSMKYGNKVGVIGIEEKAPKVFEEVLGDKLVKYIRPQNIYNTNDLQTEEGKLSVVKAGQDMKDSGVDVIALACTGMSTAGVSEMLTEKIGIEVVDPVYSEGAYLKDLF